MAVATSAMDLQPTGHGDAMRRKLGDGKGRWVLPLVILVVCAGIGYVGWRLLQDLEQAPNITLIPFLLLIVSLLIALGFEFVNGFHDTANAVATVIYTHSLQPHLAVVWSGLWNLAGVLVSSGAVAFTIVSLLPVELILQVGSAAGFAMVFALLIAAIIWNLGTWYFGLPNSSSHTLIGSIIGVGIANQLLSTHGGTSGVDWGQAANVGKALLFSPLVGFTGAALLLLAAKLVIRRPELYREPEGDRPPPVWVRGLLILTCTGVSFAHGSNDGQKGMGLIMLILVGTVPTAYALNRALPEAQVQSFNDSAERAAQLFASKAGDVAPVAGDPRPVLEHFLQKRSIDPQVLPALASLSRSIGDDVKGYGTLASVPSQSVRNVRNDIYLASETIRLMDKTKAVPFTGDEAKTVGEYRGHLDQATKFIPGWVKVAVAIALGMGTMVGWRRIVITVGERIGKQHLTYGQGAAAELVAMGTIGLADVYGLPVSTTHVLSSGVAGTMAANGSGLQWATIRNIGLAWILTLPASILLSGALFAILRLVFGAG